MKPRIKSMLSESISIASSIQNLESVIWIKSAWQRNGSHFQSQYETRSMKLRWNKAPRMLNSAFFSSSTTIPLRQRRTASDQVLVRVSSVDSPGRLASNKDMPLTAKVCQNQRKPNANVLNVSLIVVSQMPPLICACDPWCVMNLTYTCSKSNLWFYESMGIWRSNESRQSIVKSVADWRCQANLECPRFKNI